MYGRAGDDRLWGATGNDTLVGGAGNDTFFFSRGWGHDEVSDFVDDLDQISFGGFGFSTAQEALSHATQVGSNVVFNFGAGDTLTVVNTNLAALTDDVLIY